MDCGEDAEQTVLLLHGVPESSLIWKDIIPTIVSCGYRAIAPDLPGFGQSERFDTESTWEKYVDFITHFLHELCISKVHLFVRDWGGNIGLRWACEHPEKVLSLVISDTFFTADYHWHKTAEIWRTAGQGEQLMNDMSDRRLWGERMRKQIPGISETVLDEFFRVFSSPQDSQVVLELYRSGDIGKIKPYQGKLLAMDRLATLIWGENDPYVPQEYAYRLRDQELPNAAVHVLPNTGHFIQLEASEVVSRLIEHHLNTWTDLVTVP